MKGDEMIYESDAAIQSAIDALENLKKKRKPQGPPIKLRGGPFDGTTIPGEKVVSGVLRITYDGFDSDDLLSRNRAVYSIEVAQDENSGGILEVYYKYDGTEDG